MSIEVTKEIGHVLFIDIVSYSDVLHTAPVSPNCRTVLSCAHKDDSGFIAFAQNVGVVPKDSR